MMPIVAAVLGSLLVAPPATASQQLGEWIAWETARSLKAGTEIMVVTVGDGPPARARLLFADDSMLVTLKADPRQVRGKVQRVLLEVKQGWPAVLDGSGTFARDGVRVSQDGIFDGVQKVAGLTDVVQQTPREEIRGITRVVHGPRVGRYVLLGVLIGVAAVFGIFASMSFS